MKDKKKVIRELDKVADEANPWKDQPPLRCDISYPLLVDAIELLKGQNGKWVWKLGDRYMCSVCGMETSVDEEMEEPLYIYCPFCGAKMEWGGRNGDV